VDADGKLLNNADCPWFNFLNQGQLRRLLSLCFAEDAGHLGAAGWANSFGHATAISFVYFTSELAFGFALYAVRFACI
jgi:hypothetical protein